MKILILLFVCSVFYTSIFYEKLLLYDRSHESQKGNEFSSFLNLFFDKTLPLNIFVGIGDDSIGQYHKFISDKTGKSRRVRSRYRTIEKSLISFLPKPTTNNLTNYLAIYKIAVSKNFYTVIYAEEIDGDSYLRNASFWMHVCTYSLSGKLIDKLTLCGYKDEKCEQSGYISESFLISTKRWEFQPYNYKNQTFECFEIISEHQLSENGKMVCQTKKKRKLLFTPDGKYTEVTPFVSIRCNSL